MIVPDEIEKYAEAHATPPPEPPGCRRGGRIDTCEVDETHAEVAQHYIAQSPYATASPSTSAPRSRRSTASKATSTSSSSTPTRRTTLNYYEAVLPRLPAGGMIAADNTLWSGRVLDEEDDSEATRAIKAFNEHVRTDSRVVSVMLTIRGGVTLIWPNRTG